MRKADNSQAYRDYRAASGTTMTFPFLDKSLRRRVAFNMSVVKGPWGGANTFIAQLADYLRSRNYEVVFSLAKPVDVVILIDPRENTAGRNFSVGDIERARKSNPNLRVLHRINECDRRKNTAFMDDVLRDANHIADVTVFISKWLHEYHREIWFNDDRMSEVIFNGADPRIYFPTRQSERKGRKTIRFVTHHWSPHELKGFRHYAILDDLIHCGVLPDAELWVIGRWPEAMQWKSARLIEPANGRKLANLLRQCDLYITASQWEPGGMHHVEGAQCGLPMVYHEDGGGIVDMCSRYGIGFRDDLESAVNEAIHRRHELRQHLLRNIPSGDRMVHDYADIIQRLIADS